MGQHAHVKSKTGHSGFFQRVAAHFHRHGAGAAPRHAAQQVLKLHRERRGVLQGAQGVRRAVSQGAHVLAPHHLGQENRGGCFAVGARHGIELQLAARVAAHRRNQRRQVLVPLSPRAGHQDRIETQFGTAGQGRLLAHHHGASTGGRHIGQELVRIPPGGGHCHPQRTSTHRARIGGDGRDLTVSAHHAGGGQTRSQRQTPEGEAHGVIVPLGRAGSRSASTSRLGPGMVRRCGMRMTACAISRNTGPETWPP